MLRLAITSSLFLALALSVFPLHAANPANLIPHNEARRFGLERAWFSRIAIDPSNGTISQISQHVSSTNAYTIYEVAFPGATLRFSERDVDRSGTPIGKQRARKLALRKVDDLQQAGREATISEHTVPDITLYVSTDRGIVQALDGETGRTRWVREIGKPGLGISTPGANDQYAAVTNGPYLFLLNASDGKIAWQRKTRGAPAGGPTLTDRLLLVPMLRGAVESYSLSDLEQTPWVFQGSGQVAQPIYNGDVVAWPTNRGHLYIGQGDMNNMLFQIDTGGPIVAPATALHPNRLLTVSVDGYMYCVEDENGSILWRFASGERMSQSPLVVGEAVFVVTDESNLFRIRGENGEGYWPRATPGVQRLLAASHERLYCVDELGRIMVVDTETGDRLGTMSSIVPDVRVANRQTDRIFLATRRGFIQCLHEIQNPWPIIHLDAAETDTPATDPQNGTVAAAEGDTEEAAAEVETDPFGAPLTPAADPFNETEPAAGDSDPFSTDTDPFGGATADEDPFAPTGDDPF